MLQQPQPSPALPDHQDLLRIYRSDLIEFSRDCIKVRDHNTAQIVPFHLNRGQRILHAIAEKQKAEKGYVRILLLKSRRFGGSTYVEARYYHQSSMQFNRSAFIIAHEEDSTSTLFRMAKLMQEQNPLTPSIIASNAQELRFDNAKGTGLKSEYRLATARNVDAGKSQGIHYLHISEESSWPDSARELLGGLFQCVPDPPAESEIFRESTAKGYGNTFQEAVFDAYAEGRHVYWRDPDDERVYAWHNPGESDWVCVFIPWYVHERYIKAFESPKQREAFEKQVGQKVFYQTEMRWMESEASQLRAKHGLTLEQLHWRDWAIKNKCQGRLDLFRQEYPAAVEEAFLSSGSNVFPKELCDEMERGCCAPMVTGELVLQAGKVRIRPNPNGHFQVWERPEAKETYFVVVDSAGGKKEQREGAGESKPDYTNIDVFNHRTGVQVAQWHGHIDYDMIADLVEMIGTLYNRAKACVELQNHGYTVVAGLVKARYPQYEHKPGEPGWQTNKATKPQSIDGLYEMTRDGKLQLRSKETVSEMRTFVEKDMRYGAASGCKDDRVMTAAIGSQLMQVLPRKMKEGRNEGSIVNWQKAHEGEDDGKYREYYA